jgi:superfamily II DNA or RNA helicase
MRIRQAMHEPGLFEQLITEEIESRLQQLPHRVVPIREGLRAAEAADRVALQLARVVERALDDVPDEDRVKIGIDLARQLITAIASALPKSDAAAQRPVAAGELLRAIATVLPDGSPEDIAAPLIPLLDTALLTNAPGEPRVGLQIGTEIDSADGIDVLMAFVRQTGINPLIEALRRHCARGRGLRVLTTVYTNSTELKALERLRDIGAQIRVSYDTSTTRLHAKAWLFHRQSGFSTAYIGSSNLTHSAQVTGLEWNVRVSGARNPDVVAKMAAVFESYWHNPDFVAFDAEEFADRTRSDRTESLLLSPLEVRLEPFQERLLEQIALARQRGRHRNLLVSATGTGKTVMAAVDYARLRGSLPRSRLLFVAHREEILEKSRATFRQVLRDRSFGELWVRGERPRAYEHVFASVQSLSVADLNRLEPDAFDVVVIDEFHHAAAPSYVRLLEHLKPRELLGLTATPERADELPVLHWFDGQIAAELRLWDAIDQHRLVPFAYYGVGEEQLDFRNVPWRRGRGYDVEGLTNVLTANDAIARLVLKELERRVPNVRTMRALGFCVSVQHARFMARVFNEAKVSAVAVWGDSPEAERRDALAALADGRVQAVFSVDLFNEGVDVPLVDTLLMLRPTDSATLFLQQLGRGLRRAHGKTICTALDFVGQHRKEFRYDRRFRALLRASRKELEQQIGADFPFLPAGCHMELDRVAKEVVLANVRAAIPQRWSEWVVELRRMEISGRRVLLREFLDETGLELEDLYGRGKSWSELRESAGAECAIAGSLEQELRKACTRLMHVDDPVRIEGWHRWLKSGAVPKIDELCEHDRRLLRMLVASVVGRRAGVNATLQQATDLLWAHPQVRAELVELLEVLAERPAHVTSPVSGRSNLPLQIHAKYTRIEIMAAFGVGSGTRMPLWNSGVMWVPSERVDLLAITLDKTSGQFSPTTRYRDYAISRDRLHWESQSRTAAHSATGIRYQQHRDMGTDVMPFVRLRAEDRAFVFLGNAGYVRHAGEKPMAIEWHLRVALPGDLFAEFAAAVA